MQSNVSSQMGLVNQEKTSIQFLMLRIKVAWWHQDIMMFFGGPHVQPGYPGDNPAAPKASQ